MKLTYRGVSYDYNPPEVPTFDSGNVGTYRGLDVRFRNPQKQVVLQPTLDLKYRGVAYRTGEGEAVNKPQTETAGTAAGAYAMSAIADKARALMLERHRQICNRQQVMLDRAAESIGLEHAAAKLSRIQGKIQNDLQLAYAPSTAAMS